MTDPIRPDDVIPPEGGASLQARRLLRDAGLALPNLVKLLGRLLKDPRVPRRSKLVVLGAVGYAASPIDLIPDFIPVAGVMDDLLLVVFAVNHLIHSAGEEVVLEHWSGPQDLLGLAQGVLDIASDLLPRRLRLFIGRFTGP
ncbi:MAG: YkvA family protein [Acidimicrobiia bacterium]